ncbi:MAG: NAD(P)H-dependent oxidoreductase subunit E [Candidatus Rokuibacteriota bacterium]
MDDPIRSLLAGFPRERTWLLPALQAVQETEGWLSLEALAAVAEHLRVPPSEVSAIATDYAAFRLVKPGSHVVRVCTGLSCRLNGAADHLRALEDRLGIARGSTTPDGRLTLEEADCLSLCSLAPVLEVDGVCHGRVASAAVERLPVWFRPRRPLPMDVDASDFPQVHVVGQTARERLAYLGAQAGARARTRPEFRFLVQGGSCGEALGAGAMIKALRLLASMRGLAAEVLDGACHGMCAAGIVVEVQRAGWPRLTFAHLTKDAVPDFLSAVAGDESPLTRFEGVAWNGEGWRGLPPAARHPFFAAQRRSIMERCGHLHPVSLDDALLAGGYSALAYVLDRQTPEDVIEEVKASASDELSAAATEWEVCRKVLAAPRYFVMNGEEGAPGLFTDCHLMEGDPHRVLEGLLIAAYAAEANRGIIHIKGGARLAFERMARALAKAQAARLIGDRILGSEFSFHVELRPGPRGFVRGEEQALWASIEGERAAPGPQPPLPVESRLWGKPTVLSNVEILGAIPPVIAASTGGRVGQGRSATRLLSVSGPVNRPGIVEVENHVTLRELLFEVAAGLRDRRTLKGVVVAGPLSIMLPPDSLDASLESLDAFAAGTRGVIPIPDGDSVAEVDPGDPAGRLLAATDAGFTGFHGGETGGPGAGDGVGDAE